MALAMRNVPSPTGKSEARNPAAASTCSPHLQVLATTLAKLQSISSAIVDVADGRQSPTSPERTPPTSPTLQPVVERDSPYLGPADVVDLSDETDTFPTIEASHPGAPVAPSSRSLDHSDRSLTPPPDTSAAQARAAAVLASARQELQGTAPDEDPTAIQDHNRGVSPPQQFMGVTPATGVEAEQLRQQLRALSAALSKATIEASMSKMQHEQELRKVQWDHELEISRLSWEHQESASSQEWQYKQALKTVSPDCPRLRGQLQQATSKMLVLQDQTRQLEQQHKLMDSQAKNKLQLCKEHYEQQIALLKQNLSTLARENDSPGSPMSACLCNICMDAAITCVFRCGHAKCAECADRLIGLGQGCPDCRAPLDEPRMIYLNVG